MAWGGGGEGGVHNPDTGARKCWKWWLCPDMTENC